MTIGIAWVEPRLDYGFVIGDTQISTDDSKGIGEKSTLLNPNRNLRALLTGAGSMDFIESFYSVALKSQEHWMHDNSRRKLSERVIQAMDQIKRTHRANSPTTAKDFLQRAAESSFLAVIRDSMGVWGYEFTGEENKSYGFEGVRTIGSGAGYANELISQHPIVDNQTEIPCVDALYVSLMGYTVATWFDLYSSGIPQINIMDANDVRVPDDKSALLAFRVVKAASQDLVDEDMRRVTLKNLLLEDHDFEDIYSHLEYELGKDGMLAINGYN